MRTAAKTEARQQRIQQWPKTAVILSLRGMDADVMACLNGLMHQDYGSRYAAWIVVDSREDPAWQAASEAARTNTSVQVDIQPLHSKRSTCSLKCSALVQAVCALDDSYEIVAFLDADVVPPPHLAEGIGGTDGRRCECWGRYRKSVVHACD